MQVDRRMSWLRGPSGEYLVLKNCWLGTLTRSKSRPILSDTKRILSHFGPDDERRTRLRQDDA